MVISEPDPAVVSPQVTFFNFPTSWEVLYFQLQMNYSADDDFSPGGFHVGALNDEVMIDEARSDLRSTLDTCYDTVRWTNVMAVFDGQLWFAVNDGQSDSWGYFGGPDYLVTMPAHWVSNLNSYDPQRSLANVDVGFGANRVQSIRLVDVKLVFTDGNIMTIPIDQSPSN